MAIVAWDREERGSADVKTLCIIPYPERIGAMVRLTNMRGDRIGWLASGGTGTLMSGSPR